MLVSKVNNSSQILQNITAQKENLEKEDNQDAINSMVHFEAGFFDAGLQPPLEQVGNEIAGQQHLVVART